MKKIIFLNWFYPPDTSATSELLASLTGELADETHDIHVIASRQQKTNAEAHLPRREVINGVTVHRVWTSNFGRKRLLGRAIDYITFYLSAALNLLLLTRRKDIVVAKTDPPLMSVIAMSVVTLKAAKQINWIQDLYPEVAAALGVKGMQGRIYKAIVWLRNASLKTAKMNVCLGEQMAARLKREGVGAEKIRVIPNWVTNDAVEQNAQPEETDLRTEWGLNGKFVIGYMGNLGRAYDFGDILSAAETLRQNPAVVFLIVGNGVQLDLIKEEVKKRQLNNVMFKPYQPSEKLAQSLAVPDIHLVMLKPELEGLIVPSKIYGITAVGRPILFIGDKDGELATMLTGEKCGLAIADNQPGSIAEEIATLQENPKRAKTMGNNARKLYEKQFGKKRSLSAWEELLCECAVS